MSKYESSSNIRPQMDTMQPMLITSSTLNSVKHSKYFLISCLIWFISKVNKHLPSASGRHYKDLFQLPPHLSRPQWRANAVSKVNRKIEEGLKSRVSLYSSETSRKLECPRWDQQLELHIIPVPFLLDSSNSSGQVQSLQTEHTRSFFKQAAPWEE